MKACLSNLIIFTEDTKQLHYINEIASLIVSKYPARIILIHSHQKIDEIQVEKTQLSDKLYEQVTVHLPKKNQHSLNLFVLPYLIPDLPNYLFYSGNPVKEHPIFNELIRLSTRLIVDSETSDNLCSFCTTILDQITKHNLEVIDLNWARTLGWRLILSNLFDDQEKLKNLACGRDVKIEYHQSAHALNPALYLQAWLASCLHWEFRGRKGTEEILYTHEEGSVKVQLIPTLQDYHGEAINRIELITQDEMSYNITLHQDQPQAIVHICSVDSCSLPYTIYFPNFQRGTSYLSQLLYSSTSKQYSDILPILKKFYA